MCGVEVWYEGMSEEEDEDEEVKDGSRAEGCR
jgi:hypothetical protein